MKFGSCPFELTHISTWNPLINRRTNLFNHQYLSRTFPDCLQI